MMDSGYALSLDSSILVHLIFEFQEAKFLIGQQKYLEYLESGKTAIALHVLRNELASINTDPELLHPLSRFVIFLPLHLPGSDRSP